MKKGLIVLLVITLVTIGIVSATYSVNNYSIDKNYGPRDTLRGWIEISLSSEASNSIFKSSEGDSMTLFNLIKANKNFSYTCDPLSCSSDYEKSNQETTKSFVLNSGESGVFGFEITGDAVSDISNFAVDVISNAGKSSSPQLTIDILNDGQKEWQAHTVSGDFGGALYGCYVSAEGQAVLTQTQYCQKIIIPSTPNLKIGAKLIGSGTTNFRMSIESMDYGEYGECGLTASGTGFVSCEPDGFSVNNGGNYFVCIWSEDSDSGYTINYERTNPCGFSGNFNDKYDFDFEIFVIPGKYGDVGSFTLNDAELSSINSPVTDIGNYILDYLYDKYGNDCSDGCIIPVKINSMVNNQAISVSDATLNYVSGISIITHDLYDLNEIPAKINANMQKLSIDSGNFSVPSEYGNHTFSLNFKGNRIFSEKITIEKAPIIKFLDPLTTATSYPTTFTIIASSDNQVNLYEWDFGNGDTEITTTNKVVYSYNSTGTYNIDVRVIDIYGRSSSKSFEVVVGSASEVTGTLLQKKKANLENVKKQIEKFSGFERTALNQILNTGDIQVKLNNAETENDIATTEEDYQAVLQDLLDIKIPKMVFLGSVADSIAFYPKESGVNPGILAEITGEEYDSSKEDKYVDAILGWDVENVDMTLTYKEITSAFEDHTEPLLKTFNIDVKKKAGSEADSYIILKKVEGLTFFEDYSEEEISGYIYIPLTGESTKIIFATTEDVDFIDLPFFVSPGISELSLVGLDLSPFDKSGKLKKWALFTLIMILLIIIGITFWVVLHAWYKKKYEDYLFKNKNNLYNLFTWIEGAKKRGLDEKEMRNQLRKAGWTSEQLTYALRKYAGKRTGMPGIPLSKILKRRKKSMPQGKLPGNPQPEMRKKF